ncbi:MAG: ABC transporter permease subunit, partial [Clostridia bacterium]
MASATTAKLPKNSLRKMSFGKQMVKNWQLYVFLAPALIYFIIFHYIPMYGVQIAFKDFIAKLGIDGSPWVGFKHFATFFHMENVTDWSSFVQSLSVFFNRTSWNIVKNTLLLSGYTLLAGFPVPVLLALMLNEVKSIRYKKIVQNVTYAPNFIAMVVMVSMITMFFSNSGIINVLLGFLGIPPTNYLMDEGTFRHLYVWTGVWQSMGWSSIIYFAALSAVDPQLHEAATIDGASKLQRLIHI